MQAVAGELSGYAGKFRCLLTRSELVASAFARFLRVRLLDFSNSWFLEFLAPLLDASPAHCKEAV
jgi:hypothetical protein